VNGRIPTGDLDCLSRKDETDLLLFLRFLANDYIQGFRHVPKCDENKMKSARRIMGIG
jgi:hypothetical protein